VSFRAGYTLANGWPVWSELTWLTGNHQALVLGAGTRIRLNNRFDLTAQMRAKTILGGAPSTETALELGVSHALASGGRLTVGAGVKVTSSAQASSAAAPYLTIGYTRPFTIFGPLKVGRVAADVFIDRNGNGRRDADEAGVGGVTIRIDDRSASRTDAGGRSTIDGVREGEYRVSVDEDTVPVGFVVLQPEVRARVAADGKTPVAFALTPGATLQCLVYLDENGNGIRDKTEQGVADVGAALQPLGRVTATDLDGILVFRDLKPGTYTLTLDGRGLPHNIKLAGVTSYTTTLAAGATAACELPVVNGKKVVVTFP
ncbi:MAG: SdrD B-like domain-containing protein, partial [bacterium]